jgi:regulator of cell morphogenesis and NO signaling
MSIDVHQSVVDWVIDHPESIAVFRQYAIDYCCAGKSLEVACRQAGVSLPEVATKLRDVLSRAAAPSDREQTILGASEAAPPPPGH